MLNNKFLKYIRNPGLVYVNLSARGFLKKVADLEQVKRLYYIHLKKKLDLDNPKTFNEKLQYLKLYDRQELYSIFVDKYEVKNLISNIIGKKYIIPTIGVYNNWDEIDFDSLPSQFVIKCTHDSGGIIICKDKSLFDIRKAKKDITNFLKRNYYYVHREWPYKNVKPRILIEKYMSDEGQELQDFKVHCFNGEPKFILVCRDRFKESGLTEDFFDINWKHLNVKRPNHDFSSVPIEKPVLLNEMLELSRKLSNDIPFVRTDFYIINNQLYFGEMTFYPASGFVPFVPEEWDYKFGEWLQLPNKGDNNEK